MLNVKIWYQLSLRTSVRQGSCVPTTRLVKEIIVGNRQQFTGSVTSHTRTIVYPLRNHSAKPSQYRDRSMEPHFSFATFLLLKATQRALDLNGTLRVYKSEEKGKWKATERRVPFTLETQRDIQLSLYRKQNVLSFYFIVKYLYGLSWIVKSSALVQRYSNVTVVFFFFLIVEVSNDPFKIHFKKHNDTFKLLKMFSMQIHCHNSQ